MSKVVFSFIRANPPTKGHELLVRNLLKLARGGGANHILFLSQTQNTQNPLDWSFKTKICQTAFPGVNVSTDSAIKTPFMALESLAQQYDEIILVVGSDRVREFQTRMTPYAQKWNVNDFRVMSAGERDPDDDGVAGISGSKMREWALEGNKEEFFKWLPERINSSIAEIIFQKTLEGLQK